MNGGVQHEANWYPDPQDLNRLRYWDGQRWTEHTAARPPEQQQPQPVQQQAAFVVPQTAHPQPQPHAQVLPQVAAAAVPEPPARSRGGLLGNKKALEAELAQLRAVVDGFGYAEREALQGEIGRLRNEQQHLAVGLNDRRHELAQLDAALVRARDEVILQEVGVYDYRHRLEDSVAYKAQLDALRAQIREMSKKDGGAVLASTNWTVEGSAAKGRKMVNEISKLLLRAYNGEADVLVNKLKPYKLDAAIDHLGKSRSVISKLGATMNITIAEPFHRLRVQELTLTADFLAKKEAEKEAERAEKERLREEAKARREFEAERARLAKEQTHYQTVLERLRVTGTPEEVAAAETRLAEVGEAIEGVDERAANIRAGYVYVISNVGAFGPGVVKIGMTRRLDPLDRVRELGDASVPFRYDVHALVFSQDAVNLETHLHHALADRRVNLVNLRREFFYATPAEVEAVLTRADGSVLEFTAEPEADEWHQSENARRQSGFDPPAVLSASASAPASVSAPAPAAFPPGG